MMCVIQPIYRFTIYGSGTQATSMRVQAAIMILEHGEVDWKCTRNAIPNVWCVSISFDSMQISFTICHDFHLWCHTGTILRLTFCIVGSVLNVPNMVGLLLTLG